jgi:hypothetical protein
MAEALDVERDPVLEALAGLSEAAASSADDLAELHDDLARIRQSRLEGSSWRHIISDTAAPHSLSQLTKIVASLALACGGFRRALAHGLRREGLQVTEIAAIFKVSRQRVGALIRSTAPGGEGDGPEATTDSAPGLP